MPLAYLISAVVGGWRSYKFVMDIIIFIIGCLPSGDSKTTHLEGRNLILFCS